ncbi:MAG: glycoside hydrolase family 15 protein [Candidatus Aramenus sp.]|nr:glycoside hydrolase family 15 protein [Candidatus Aramenus sp.]
MKELAFLSNQMTSALISMDTNVAWFPAPRFDSSPIFASILDEEHGGEFRVVPRGKVISTSREYLTYNVLRTTIYAEGGKVTVTDLLPIGEPAIIRKVEAEIPVRVKVYPTFNYALHRPVTKFHRSAIQFLNPVGDDCVGFVYGKGEREGNEVLLPKGTHFLYLVYFKNAKHGLFSEKSAKLSLDVEEAFNATVSFWKGKEKRAEGKLAKGSYTVLYGVLYSPTSAPVASPTTSLPEVVGGKRNWDYRFAWIRDSSIVAQDLIEVGEVVTGRRILNFLLGLVNFASKPFRHPLYTVDGEDPPPEVELKWLPGYKGSAPVRVGNKASEQLQLDVEGFFMSALWKYYEKTGDLVFLKEVEEKVKYIANWVSRNWGLTDASIWEERGVSRHYTHSKAMMWVALKRAGEVMRELGEEDYWKESREKLREWIFNNCVHEGYLTRYAGSTDVDSALLSLPLYGFLDVKDEVFLRTLRKIEENLKVGPFVKRYASDFMGEAKHPFLLTTLWLARVYVRLGKKEEAMKVVEELDKLSPLGLVGEHLDVEEGDFAGNFPQAFVHAELLALLKELGVKL